MMMAVVRRLLINKSSSKYREYKNLLTSGFMLLDKSYESCLNMLWIT